jgi:hypothetical protein
VLALLLAFVPACGRDDAADVPPTLEATATNAAPAAAAPEGLAGAEIGHGSVWYDGVQHDDFLGDCQLSRLNGREEMGDLANLEGVRISVGIDNVASSPAMEMNFVVYSSLDFTMVRGAERMRGTISQLAYESELSPKGTSQAIAKVAFTGATGDGVPVVARVWCEIQNKF